MHTQYGDFTAHTKNGDFTFRPSLENISKIGDPQSIINTFSDVHMFPLFRWIETCKNIENSALEKAIPIYKNKAMIAAKLILTSCCDRDATEFFGDWDLVGKKIVGRVGLESNPDKILTLAKHLMFHGVVGKSDNKETKKGAKKSPEFKAVEYVTMARNKNGLGLSREEAWSMTMTELVMEMEAIIPPKTDDNGAPTDEQYDNVMAMIADIEKRKKNGS